MKKKKKINFCVASFFVLFFIFIFLFPFLFLTLSTISVSVMLSLYWRNLKLNSMILCVFCFWCCTWTLSMKFSSGLRVWVEETERKENENFVFFSFWRKSWNCYLLIKYWFKITSFNIVENRSFLLLSFSYNF